MLWLMAVEIQGRGRGPKVLRGMRRLAAQEAQEKGESEWPYRGHLEPRWAESGSLLSLVCQLGTVRNSCPEHCGGRILSW